MLLAVMGFPVALMAVLVNLCLALVLAKMMFEYGSTTASATCHCQPIAVAIYDLVIAIALFVICIQTLANRASARQRLRVWARHSFVAVGLFTSPTVLHGLAEPRLPDPGGYFVTLVILALAAPAYPSLAWLMTGPRTDTA